MAVFLKEFQVIRYWFFCSCWMSKVLKRFPKYLL